MANYLITVEGETFELTKEALNSLDIISTDDSHYHILSDLKSYKVKVVETDFQNKRISLEVNGNPYHLSIADPLDQMVDKMGMFATKSKQINEVTAPMPGLIIDIMATIGQEVAKGTPLLVLSAMKMENIITSPGQGVIKQLVVQIDDAVEKGQLLIELE